MLPFCDKHTNIRLISHFNSNCAIVQDAAVRAVLIGAIRPHVAALRNNMFGKRILSKTYLKNRKH